MHDCYGRHFTLDLIDIDHTEKNVNSLVYVISVKNNS